MSTIGEGMQSASGLKKSWVTSGVLDNGMRRLHPDQSGVCVRCRQPRLQMWKS